MWFEHMTLRVWTECSSQLSYAAILFCRPHPEWDTGENGCGGGTWTPDLRVMSPTSYQLLYPAIWRFPGGAGDRTRTGTAFLPGDFKSPVSTIPPHRRTGHLLEYHTAPPLSTPFPKTFPKNISTNPDLAHFAIEKRNALCYNMGRK